MSHLYVRNAHDSGIDDISIWDGESDLHQMIDTLKALGYAGDAARDTENLLLMMQNARLGTQRFIDRLWKVWRAVERMQSGDSGPEEVEEALAGYRGKRPS